jgi:hypothetical protein
MCYLTTEDTEVHRVLYNYYVISVLSVVNAGFLRAHQAKESETGAIKFPKCDIIIKSV